MQISRGKSILYREKKSNSKHIIFSALFSFNCTKINSGKTRRI